MIIYYHGSRDKPLAETLTMYVAPAAMAGGGEHIPSDWWQTVGNEKRPKEFTVVFTKGRAEVDDRLGTFMVDHEMAARHRPVILAPWE